MKKIRHGFLGLVHVSVLALPLVFIAIMLLINVLNGYQASAVDGVASMSTNYSQSLDINSVFTYFNTNYQFSLDIVNIDFLDVFNIDTTLDYMVFTNWYLNYLINMELVVFLPEILLMFFKMARNLVTCWSNKISGGY